MRQTPASVAQPSIALVAVAALVASGAQGATRWAGVVVGANRGDGSTKTLRYAEHDAASVAATLIDVGLVDASNLVQLRQPSVDQVRDALEKVGVRLNELRNEPSNRVAVVFYFSGHSDGEVMELGDERLSWSELRAMLAGVGADVRLVVVDACKSGGAARTKGGAPSAAFPVVIDRRDGLTGEVVLTSASSSESAHESTELQGSYFTAALTAGLRGAADANRDRQVTLGEAYRYAFERTVSSTAMLGAQPQHPAYHYELSGEGELVLGRVSGSRLSLKLGGQPLVRVFDSSGRRLVAELEQARAELTLAPGAYRLEVVRGPVRLLGQVHVEPNGVTTATWSDLAVADAVSTPVKTVIRCRARASTRALVPRR